MRKILLFFFCLIVFLTTDDRAGKDDILSYVEENEDTLMECIQNNDFSPIENVRLIRDIDADRIDSGFVEFGCGGAGFGPETDYRGFYYSADDDMTEIWCAPRGRAARESGDGYLWKDIGDNTYYSEHICGHFYYYDAHF